MLRLPSFGRDARVNALICSGHFLSHHYQLCLPPLFIVWQQGFGVSYAELGLAMALMSGTAGVVQARIGRSFSLHTFVGNAGFAAASPVTAALMLLIGWRSALLLVGLAGLPVVLSIVWQSRILVEQRGAQHRRKSSLRSDARFLLSRSILSFFAFFLVSSMAGAGIQSWLITVLHRTTVIRLKAASYACTSYVTGDPVRLWYYDC